MKNPSNSFPGPVPLQEGDKIFGRTRETAELIDRLVSDRFVLLYSPSGAGKSSLLNAGVIFEMKRRGVIVSKTIRVGRPAPEGVNRYVWNCLTSLELANAAPLPTLAEALISTEAEELLVFDQFEEVLTADPTDEADRTEFFRQLGEALRSSGSSAVFAAREDYLAPLQDYFDWLPTQLASRIRLNVLSDKAAMLAITGTVASAGITVDDKAAAAIVTDLAGGSGFVEPVQLQVVCKRFWDALPEGTMRITEQLRTQYAGSAESALEDYYSDTVKAVANNSGTPERLIRDWFDDQLISNGTRLQAIKGKTETAGLSNDVVDALEKAHLIRSDVRRNTTWCELTHDRLIRAVTNNNIAWKKATFSLLQREAELWVKAERSPDRLLQGKSLREATGWARNHTAEIKPTEREYLRLSKKARNRRRLAKLAVAAVFVALCYGMLEAEIASVERHIASTKEYAQAALRASQEEPIMAASWATSAAVEFDSLEKDDGFFLHVVRWIVNPLKRWNWVDGDDESVEAENITTAAAASVAMRDPRYRGGLWGDPTNTTECIWLQPNGKALSAIGPRGGQPFNVDAAQPGKLVPASGPIPSRCGVGADGRAAGVRFDLPEGWSVKIPDSATGEITFTGKSKWGMVTRSVPALGQVRRVVVDPTGSRAAWTTLKTRSVYTLELTTGKEQSLPGGDLEPFSVKYSPDGNILAVGGRDQLVRLWYYGGWSGSGSAKDEGPLQAQPLRIHQDTVLDLAFTQDGRTLYSAGAEGVVAAWHIDPDFAPVSPYAPPPPPMAFLPERLYLTVDREARILSVREPGKTPKSIPLDLDADRVTAVNMSGDGGMAAALLNNGTFFLFDLKTGHSTGPFSDDTADINSVALSDDGSKVYWGNSRGVVRVMEISHGQATGQPRDFVSLATGAGIRSLTVFDRAGEVVFAEIGLTNNHILAGTEGQLLKDPTVGVRSSQTAVDLALNGANHQHMASLDEGNVLQLWYINGDQTRPVSVRIPGSPQRIAFSRDGKWLWLLMASGRELKWPLDPAELRRRLDAEMDRLGDLAPDR